MYRNEIDRENFQSLGFEESISALLQRKPDNNNNNKLLTYRAGEALDLLINKRDKTQRKSFNRNKYEELSAASFSTPPANSVKFENKNQPAKCCQPLSKQKSTTVNGICAAVGSGGEGSMPKDILLKLKNVHITDNNQDDDILVDYSLQYSDTGSKQQQQQQQKQQQQQQQTVGGSQNSSVTMNNNMTTHTNEQLRRIEKNFHPQEKPTNFAILFNDESTYNQQQQKQQQIQQDNQRDEEQQQRQYKAERTATDNNTNVHMYHRGGAGSRTSGTGGSGNDDKSNHQQFDSGAITPASTYNYRMTSAGRRSGTRTPRTPMYQETPLVFSRTSPVSSLSMEEGLDFLSEVTSNTQSHMSSGRVSPSDLPDSPGGTMPPSRSKTPPGNPPGERNGLRTALYKKQRSVDVRATDDGMMMALVSGMSSAAAVPLTFDSSTSVVSLPSVVTVCGQVRKPVVGVGESDTSQKKKKEEEADEAKVVGYISSLPARDELLKFKREESCTPMTALSIMSCLIREENEVDARMRDFVKENDFETTSGGADGGEVNRGVVNNNETVDDDADDFGNSSDSSFGISGDNEDLMQQAIKRAYPRKS